MSNASISSDAMSIPHEVFDTHSLPSEERFGIWRESVLPLFEPRLDESPSQDFYARIDAFDLKRLFVCLAEFSAQRYVRARKHAAGEHADHLLIQLYMTGGYVGHNGNRPVRVGPGDISLLDLSAPLETQAENSSTVSVVIPRERMFSLVPPDHLRIGSVITADSAVGRILGNHLTSVWRALRTASASEVAQIHQTILGAVAGAFEGAHRGDDTCETLSDQTVLDAMRTYIDRNLPFGPVTRDMLCQQFRCPRSRLDRIFEPLGGVTAYLLRARLEQCLHELADPYTIVCNVADTAMRWGFSDENEFRKLFREHFGFTPEEAVEQTPVQYDVTDAADRPHVPHPAFGLWLRRL